ncbi:MAG: HAD hydrolase family protein [Candidatus Omnitrophica bacterium]|nr:HAD hydrolase family protein [Candidatus Omnitrophota bacterium]
MPPQITKTLLTKLARVRLFLCDVDGILTDTSVWMGNEGETKRFCVRDGLGLRLLRQTGIKVGWISGRPSPATEQRARELEVDFLCQSRDNKVTLAKAILDQTGLSWQDICYMGDDIVDLGLLRRAGLAVVVPSAIEEAKATADYITRKPGGQGAVREVVELILKAQNKWETLVRDYSA